MASTSNESYDSDHTLLNISDSETHSVGESQIIYQLRDEYYEFIASLERKSIISKVERKMCDFFDRMQRLAVEAVKACAVLKAQNETEKILATILTSTAKQTKAFEALQKALLSKPASQPKTITHSQPTERLRPTFAEVAKHKNKKQSQNTTDYPLIITAKDSSDQSQTKTALKTAFDPVANGIGVSNLRTRRSDGSVVLSVRRPEERTLIVQKLCTNQTFANTFSVREIKKRDPRMRLLDVPEMMTDNEVAQALYTQNSELTKQYTDLQSFKSEIKFIFHTKPFKGYKNIVIQVSPKLRRAIKSIDRLKLVWHLINAEDYILVTRCFQCLGLGHLSHTKQSDGSTKNCSHKTVCSHCSGEHKFADCPLKTDSTKKQCVNCIKDKTRNPTIKTDHSAMSNECPHLLRYKQNEFNRTNYG